MNNVDIILAKFDALNQRFDKLEKGNVNAIGATNVFCEVCGLQGHTAIDYQVGMPDNQEEQIELIPTISTTTLRKKSSTHIQTHTTRGGEVIQTSHTEIVKVKYKGVVNMHIYKASH